MSYHIGDIIQGTVTGLQPYGAFISLDEHTQGLVHISECQHGYVKQISDSLKVGESVKVLILDIDEYSKKISLSIRALYPDPNQRANRQRKHFFSKKHVAIGFKTIADAMPAWLNEALTNIKAVEKK